MVPGIVDQSDTANDLILFIGHCDLHFKVPDLYVLYAEHNLVDSHHTVGIVHTIYRSL